MRRGKETAVDAFLEQISATDTIEIATDGWEFWAHSSQLPPDGDWRVWLFIGGRGAGKTRAGAEWVRSRIALGARRGCPAVDKGANQPNVFVDRKSAESALPHFSAGSRDDLIQRRYLEALIGHWAADATVSSVYAGPMIDPADIHVWTWDARPFPDFPARDEVWGDGANWRLGHWLTGRMGLAPLGDVVRDLASGAGVDADVSGLDGLVSGYLVERPMAVRDALMPLAELFGFMATDTAGDIRFGRPDGAAVELSSDALVLTERGETLRCERQDFAAMPADLRVHFIADEDDYARSAVLARNRLGAARGVADLAVPLLADSGQAENWARLALRRLEAEGERFDFTLPPSALAVEPGDRIRVVRDADTIDLTISDMSGDTARHVSGSHSLDVLPALAGTHPGTPRGSVRPPSQAQLFVLDLPLFGSESVRSGPLAAVAAEPWYGIAAVHAGEGLDRRVLVERPCLSGLLLEALAPAPSGRLVEQTVTLVLDRGGLESVTKAAVLAGANRLAIKTGDEWEIVQFRDATLIGDGIWQIAGLLRGQSGSETNAAIPAASRFVVLDAAPASFPVEDHERNVPIEVRAGPARRVPEDSSYASETVTVRRADLRPLSPAHLNAVREDGVLTVRWIRRTRIGGDAWGVSNVPLGEAFERYQITVGAPGGSAETFESDGPEWSLESGDEAALFGGLLDEVEIAVRQVSERYGPGRSATGVFVL